MHEIDVRISCNVCHLTADYFQGLKIGRWKQMHNGKKWNDMFRYPNTTKDQQRTHPNGP